MKQIKLVSLDFLFKLISSSPYGNVNLTTLNMPEVNEFFGVREISVFNDGDLDVIQEHIQIAMKRNVDFEDKTWKNNMD